MSDPQTTASGSSGSDINERAASRPNWIEKEPSRTGPPCSPGTSGTVSRNAFSLLRPVELDELPAHPLHQAREVFFHIDGGPGVGSVLQTRTPLGTPTNTRPPPRLGEHTAEVLSEWGTVST